jgi:hypothetical protein
VPFAALGGAVCSIIFSPNLAWLIFCGAAIASMIQGGFFLENWRHFGRITDNLGARFCTSQHTKESSDEHVEGF